MSLQRVTVLYPNKDGARFDFDYYLQKHIPWVAGLVGNKIEVRRGIASTSGGASGFVCIASIPIHSMKDFQDILAKHGAAILADIPNYTNIEPIVQFDEVLP